MREISVKPSPCQQANITAPLGSLCSKGSCRHLPTEGLSTRCQAYFIATPLAPLCKGSCRRTPTEGLSTHRQAPIPSVIARRGRGNPEAENILSTQAKLHRQAFFTDRRPTHYVAKGAVGNCRLRNCQLADKHLSLPSLRKALPTWQSRGGEYFIHSR